MTFQQSEYNAGALDTNKPLIPYGPLWDPPSHCGVTIDNADSFTAYRFDAAGGYIHTTLNDFVEATASEQIFIAVRDGIIDIQYAVTINDPELAVSVSLLTATDITALEEETYWGLDEEFGPHVDIKFYEELELWHEIKIIYTLDVSELATERSDGQLTLTSTAIAALISGQAELTELRAGDIQENINSTVRRHGIEI